jgi:hypothetical protein
MSLNQPASSSLPHLRNVADQRFEEGADARNLNISNQDLT